ncbi:MAG: cytochrome c [Verrucomicrobia bacterium]|nr:cytochrome c [Verrucomicrobiota bacterium]
MPRWFLTPLLALSATLASAQNGKLLYEQNCAACHLPDQMVVGPSLIEITKLYDKKPKEFVAWAIKPLKKRNGVIEMPSMAHLGEANLLAVHEYMLTASKGLKEKPAITRDPLARPARRPEIQRMFLPNVGPAAIAVALPGDLNYTFDAGDCRLRTVWRGDFLDCWAYYKSNGRATATPLGKTLWQLPADESLQKRVKFLGYSVDPTGIPTFEYERDGAQFREKIVTEGKTLVRRFEVTTTKPITLLLDAATKSSAGTVLINSLTLTPAEAKSFTLTLRLL